MDIQVDQSAVTELAAQKVADAILERYDDLADYAEKRIEEIIASTITDEMRASMVETIDQKLNDEIEKALSQEIVPVDIWGEATGDPTTIRQQLHKRALEYWEERVEPDRNNSGRYRKTSYGGVPRHKLVFQDVAEEAFRNAMRANVTEMVAAFRDAMKRDTAKIIEKYIGEIINDKVIERERRK